MKFRATSSLISLLFWQLQLFTVCRAEEASKFAHDLFPLGRPIKKPFHISSYARDGVGKFKHGKEDIQGNDTTAERLGFSYKVPEDETQRDHVIPYGHAIKKSRDHSHYGSSANSYAYGASRHEVDAIGQKDTTNNFISENDAHQVIAGIPDLSDPCFRRYANTIIVNAQPYERRSSISLINCKRRCLESQIGVYSCRSFVYDNINQVCDLFPHVGDQSPARLLRFQTRDYFEPTSAISCSSSNFEAIIASTTTVFPPAVFPTEETTVSAAPSTVVEVFRDENSSVEQENTPTPFQPVPDFDLLIGTGVGPQSCKEDQIARFLKTQDFSLDGHDDLILENTSLDDCIRFCLNNFVNGSAFKCSSFDYSPNKCILSTEVAVPLGNGQLKQNVDIAYYEKVCVDEQLAKDCPIVYNRYPQKILVGFAETVIDAPTLQECFDNCLNSQKLYGFRCTSGMYYFEEAQLNCILNTEDRTTQSELFASENTDLVDYFETGCNRTSSNANKRFASYTQRSMAKSRDFIEPTKFASKTLYKWTEWSSCNGNSPKQTRKKICENGKICGQEERVCPTQNNDFDPERLLTAIRKAKCVMDKCCKVFNHCNVGIIQDSTTRRLEWCTNPCH